MNLRRLQTFLADSTVRRIRSNALALLAMQAGQRLLGLALAGGLAHFLGAAGLNRYLLAMTIQAVGLAVTGLGLNTLVTREMAIDDIKQNDRDRFLSMALAIRLTLASLGAIALALGAGHLFGAERRIPIILASLGMLPETVILLVSSFFNARQQMFWSAGLLLGTRSLATLGGLGGLALGYDERGVLCMTLLASCCGAVTGLLFLRKRRIRIGNPYPMRPIPLLRESLPFAITDIAAMFYRRADLLLLSYFWGDALSGIYGAAYRFWEALGMVPASLLDALFPELSRRGRVQDGLSSLQALYRRASRLLLVIVSAMALGILLLAPWAMTLIYGQEIARGGGTLLLRLLTLVLPASSIYVLNAHVLYALCKQQRVTRIVIVVALSNLLANWVLIPRGGLWAACGVALASEISMALTLWWMGHRALQQPEGGQP